MPHKRRPETDPRQKMVTFKVHLTFKNVLGTWSRPLFPLLPDSFRLARSSSRCKFPPLQPIHLSSFRYFIFTSFWGYKVYYVYGFMLLVALILMVVTACVTIVSTYFLLNAEDYRWRWSSFTAGGSISVYVYMYSIYYYFFKTK